MATNIFLRIALGVSEISTLYLIINYGVLHPMVGKISFYIVKFS